MDISDVIYFDVAEEPLLDYIAQYNNVALDVEVRS